MEKENKLPQFWCVKCNTNNPNWKKVIDYLNNVIGEKWEGCYDIYYGYDGNPKYKGTNCYDNWCYFKNNPTVLTIEQFVQMTEEFVFPEKWCVRITDENSSILDAWRKAQPDYKDLKLCKFSGLLLSDAYDGSYTHWGSPEYYTEITFKQFKQYIMEKEKETMKTITHTQAQEIIDIACSTWKDKLFTLWGRNIVLKKSIQILEESYQEMRKACTSDQNQLFDEIFGKDVEYKVGDWVYIIDGGTGARGADDLVGQITDKTGRHFMLQSEEGISIYTEKVIWKVNINAKLRPATEEEIEKAKYISIGIPCLVRDFDNDMWKLAYSLGNGKFKGIFGKELFWKQVQILDINNLPKY